MKGLFVSMFFFSLIMASYAQEWTEMTSLPSEVNGRHHPVTFSNGIYGYYLTGGNTVTEAENDFYRYNSEEDSWEILDDFPGLARGFSIGAQTDTKGYVGFGAGVNGILGDLWEFDFATQQWTELAECPCDPRTHPAFLSSNDGKLYVGLGGGNGNKNDWWSYDIATNTWEQKADFPGAVRHHPFQFTIGEYMYVGMGHGNDDIFNDLYRYDASSDSWDEMSSLPGEGRVAGTQFSHDGKGYVLSGDGDDHWLMEEGEFWEYTPETDEWSQLLSHPGNSRWAPGSFVIENTIYLTSGYQYETGLYINDLVAFNLDPETSVEDIGFPENDFFVFPNPVKESIQLSGAFQNLNIEQIDLLSANGTLLTSVKGIEQLSFINIQNGSYILQIFSDEALIQRKLVVLK